MNTPIKFELAKLMKEKEFRNFGCKIYHTENELRDFPNIPKFYPEAKSRKEIYEDVDIYLAPTIAEVVMWCFNKYKYSIEYSMNIPESGEYDGCYVFNGLIKGSEDYKLKIFYTSKDYPTVEKALEDTINHFLINFC